MNDDHVLSPKQKSIAPIAAYAACGDLSRLEEALSSGLDAGLSVNEGKEILVQLYAYAGFPRSLNALGILMKVLSARREQGIYDAMGSEPVRPIPTGEALFSAGAANQTKLAGSPVKGPLFDFAPAIGVFLKTHLFGDIFERDNLNWRTREMATVSMLSAISGAEGQLAAHIGISLNVGVTDAEIRSLSDSLLAADFASAAARINSALEERMKK